MGTTVASAHGTASGPPANAQAGEHASVLAFDANEVAIADGTTTVSPPPVVRFGQKK